MRVLITGGTGYIGQHLIERCLSLGWETHLILRPKSVLAPQIQKERVAIHIHDGSTKSMIEILQKAKADCVFHLATYFCAEHRAEEITGLIESNVLFGTQLLQAMVETKTPLLVNTGTAWQHFNSAHYVPVSLYAATKQAFSDILQFFTDTKKIRAINLMIFDTYGPKDTRKKLVPFLLSQAKKVQQGESLPPLELSLGEQLMNFVYISDIIDAFITAFELLKKDQSITQEEFALSSSELLSLKDFIRLFQESIQLSFPLDFGKKPYREREVMLPWHEGKRLPGWAARISLKEGIQLTWQSLESS